MRGLDGEDGAEGWDADGGAGLAQSMAPAMEKYVFLRVGDEGLGELDVGESGQRLRLDAGSLALVRYRVVSSLVADGSVDLL